MTEGNQTKRAIGRALVALTQTKPYEKISVQDIAKKAEINRQTFYYHFSDKAELLRWIYLNDSLKYLTSAELSIDNWEEQALKMLKTMKGKNVFYQVTTEKNRDVLIKEFSLIVTKLFRKLFEQVDTEGVLTEKDKDFYGRFFSYGCSGVLLAWISGGYQESPLEIATQLFQLAKDVEFFSFRMYQKEEIE
ncbi:TetR/AcrR family transcriptional regulator [Enterococcus sp. JM9B]|uniref:TetR/AcrR family transcriptional regulator n=1 Tax=Enterococcus sp. JM9B TaxID=1857216 RepID=UPI001374F85C|nr:TetR/AcrR family transcriptional regulator [Enterococcus sp. JM9B]KAF1300924.1 TetR family transcriptional regulator [Enterococcus sp. JM9B]